MCYSKEVSLIAGTIIAGSGGYTWWRIHQTAKKAFGVFDRLKQPALIPFYEQLILAFLAIGGHQFFEYLAVLTGNQIIYKIGLTTSISAVFFLIRAIEKLSGYSFGSQVVAASIAILFTVMLTVTMPFENKHFWVRGYAHVTWSVTWLWWYLYTNLAILFLASKYKKSINKAIMLIGGLLFQNVSFYLSIAYALMAVGMIDNRWCAAVSIPFKDSFNFFQDFPSIWCTFAVIQAPFLVGGIYLFDRQFKLKDSLPKSIPISWRVVHIGATLALMLVIAYLVPVIYGVSWKMVTF